jgi:hypothetical protein
MARCPNVIELRQLRYFALRRPSGWKGIGSRRLMEEIVLTPLGGDLDCSDRRVSE